MDILEAHKTGLIKELHMRGLISSDVVMYFNYYNTFTEFRKTQTFREAVYETAIHYKVSESTVKRAISKIRV